MQAAQVPKIAAALLGVGICLGGLALHNKQVSHRHFLTLLAEARADSGRVVRPPGRLDLLGHVCAPDGVPVAGATVEIYTARPRHGASPFCPSCYADCGKRTVSDAKGRFLLTSLAPDLRFRLLVIADGYEPTLFRYGDPLVGPARVVVQPRHHGIGDAANEVHGRVTGPDGTPVAGATVEPFGVEHPGWKDYGRLTGVDPLAVTDQKGKYALHCHQANVALDVLVKARGLANQGFLALRPGAASHNLTLGYGAFVHGRLLRAGRPVPGVPVGLVQADAFPKVYVGVLEAVTDNRGRFLISSVPPDQDYYIYGKMASTDAPTATVARQIHVGGDETDTDAGNLTVGPLHRLSGRIILTDGKALLMHTRLVIGRPDAGDAQVIEASPAGLFTLAGIPREPMRLVVEVSGYELSNNNSGMDERRLQRRGVNVPPDTTNIVLSLQPVGQPRRLAASDSGIGYIMFALNFYNDLYGDALKKGRKSATIRLGDKSAKYQTGQIVWVTLGQRFARRKKLFCAILDTVEVKTCGELSPRDIQRESPEMRTREEVMGLMSKIYGRDITDDDVITVIYFSPVDEYDL